MPASGHSLKTALAVAVKLFTIGAGNVLRLERKYINSMIIDVNLRRLHYGNRAQDHHFD